MLVLRTKSCKTESTTLLIIQSNLYVIYLWFKQSRSSRWAYISTRLYFKISIRVIEFSYLEVKEELTNRDSTFQDTTHVIKHWGTTSYMLGFHIQSLGFGLWTLLIWAKRKARSNQKLPYSSVLYGWVFDLRMVTHGLRYMYAITVYSKHNISRCCVYPLRETNKSSRVSP